MTASRQAFIVAAAFFLEVLDATILIPALPAIAISLHADISVVTVTMAAYVGALAVFTPWGAYVFPRAGVMRKMLYGLLMSLIASLLCALCTQVSTLLLCRVLQGAGSALVVPAGRALVLSQARKEEIPVLMSYLVWPALFAPIMAPMAGGYLAEQLGWQAIFVLIALLTLGVIAMVYAGIPPVVLDHASDRARQLTHQSRWSVAALAVFLFFFCVGSQHASGAVLCLSVASWLFYTFYRQAARLDSALFGSDLFRFGLISGSFFRVAIYCFPSLLSLALITQFTYSPSSAGQCLLFIFLGNVLAKPVAAWTLKRSVALHRFFWFGGLMTLASVVAFLLPAVACQPRLVYLLCILHGVARSFLFLAYSSVSFYALPAAQLYKANGYVGSMMQVNALIGQSIPALLLIVMAPDMHVPTGDFLTLSISMVAVLLLAAIVSQDRRALQCRH